MAIYTFTSGVESESVGQYSNELLSSLANKTIGSFTIRTARGLFGFISSDERRTYVYEPSIVNLYNELDYGFIGVAAQASIDQGSISDANATYVDYGRIYYVTNVESFGFVKLVSEASWKATQAWEGSGNIGLYGKEQSPASYKWVADGKVRIEGNSDYAFSPVVNGRGGLSLRGNTKIGISLRIVIDAATLFSFSGLDESKTYDYLATEGSLSVLAGAGDVDTAFAYLTEGTLFNFSGLDEKVVYDYAGSGTLFGFNNLEEARVYDYNCHDENVIDYFVETDYGFVERCLTSETITGDVSGDATGCLVRVEDGTTARVVSGQTYRTALNSDIATTFLDYGYIRDPANALLDYGHILTTSNVMPCGLFTFNKEIGSDNKFTPNWNGSGTIQVFGASRVPLDVSVYGAGFFKKLGGSAEAVAVAEETKDLFRISGAADIGITAITVNEGNLFGFSGAAEAVGFNPPEEAPLFKVSGNLTEKYSQAYVGEGVLFTLQTAVEKAVFDYVGSGSLFGFNNLEEARVYDYNCSSVVEFFDLDYGLIVDRNNLAITQIGTTTISTPTTAPSGAIQIALGATVTITPTGSYTVPNQISTPQYFEDYGIISERYDPVRDYGWILGTVAQGQPGCKYNQIDITGAVEVQFTPSWIGSGNIKLDGAAFVPLDAQVFGGGSIKKLGGAAETASFAETSTDLFKITGTPIVGITAIVLSEGGNLFGIGGAAESATFNPPEETPIFKFTGTAEPPLLSYSEFSSGTLFSFSGGQERNSFAWEGSGTITLLPRKPETYELSELANYTLEDYTNCGQYINLRDTSFYTGHTKLGCVQLKWLNLEESHEKHTEVYDLGLCNDEPEIDYGFIVNANVVACVDVDGVISTDTSAGTGCTRVAPGTVLAIAPGATYDIQPQITQATAFENYGEITETFSPLRDYGHILDTTGIVCPFGSLGTIGNEAEYAFVRRTVGTNELGGFIKLRSDTEIFFTPPYIVEGFIGRIGGDGYTLFSLLHPGSGNLSYFGGSAETVRWSPDEEQLLFTTNGTAVPLFSLAHYGFGTIRVTPGVDQARALRPPAGGVINIDGTALESFIANPPEDRVLFRFTGDLDESFAYGLYTGNGNLFSFGGSSELLTFAEQPTVDLRISGVAETPRTRGFIGSGGLFTFISTTESLTVNPQERQLLFSFTGAATEVLSANPPEEGTEIRLSGSTTPEILTFSEQPFGTISIFGESANAYVPNHIGSGSLFAFAGAAEAVGFNPPDITTDLKFFGTAEEVFTANPPEEGTEIKLFGSTTPEILTFAEQPFGTISVFGDAATQRARDFVGSGTLRKISGAAESITFNPEEKQMLFSFTGGITSEKHTESYVGVDTPIRIRRGALSDYETYDFQPNWNAFGVISVTGDVGIRYVPNNIGFGNIFTIGGSAESVTFNPDEKQMLFSFTGELAERRTSTHVGEGNLFAFSGGAERVAYAPSLLADIKFNGESTSKFVINNIGFGNIFNIGGASESVTFNPDERQLLFSFTGELVEAFGVAETKQIEVDLDGVGIFARSFAHEGFGTITIAGDAFDRFVVNNIGFGNIFTIGGSAESVTFNPDEKQMLFSFTGELAERTLVREISQGGTITITGTAGDPSLTFAEQPEVQIALSGDGYITASLRHIGSGSLFAFSGGAEAVGAVPPTEQALFRVSGNSVNTFAADYVGDGSLRKLSGAAESVSFNPDERQMLFSFTGERISEKRTSREISQGGTLTVSGESSVLLTFAHEGQGTISVTGDTKFTRTRDFVGFGKIPVLSGAAESLTFNPDERDMLFSFTGERISEKTTFRELGTAGKFTFTGTSGDPLLTFAEQPFVNIDVTGDSVDIRTRAYQGTGRLFGFNNGDEAFTRTGYQGSCDIKVDGIALVQVQLFQPPRTFVWII